MKAFQGGQRVSSEALGVRAVALATGAMGLVNLPSAVTPSLANRRQILERFSPLGVVRAGHLATALAGFALLLLSANLWRRKQVAWMLTEVVLVFSAVSHLYKGLDYEEALLAGALAGWLLVLRPHFHARSDPPSVRQGMATLLAALAFTLVYGTAGFYLLDRHFQVNFGLGAALRQTLLMFIEFAAPSLQPTTRFGRFFMDSIYIIGATTLTYALWMVVRPVLSRGRTGPQERERAAQIVKTWGHSSLAAITLLDDKLYYFSKGGTLIAYVVKGRTALALGDPIGPPEDFNGSLEGFAQFCGRNDWQPAFYQVQPDHLQEYTLAGYRALAMGQEGIVNLAEFTMAGGENKGLRSAVNRLSRLGYRPEIRQPPHPGDLLDELHAISDAWLTSVHGSEKHFSLGWFDEAYLNTCPIQCIVSPQGQVMAFANILSEFQANEITIDLMRHRPTGEHGIMDYMFANLLEWAREQGFTTFNLGLSALSGIGETPQDPTIERALHYIYEHINQFYNFKGLHEFKEKFHPAWSPRYLVYPGSASLPAVVIAMLQADAGDHFLSGFLR